MSLELIYTSAPKGIKPGSSGFCTVAMTQGMPAQLIDRLEALSGYRQLFAPQDPQAGLNPAVCSHLRISVAGRNYHVLSRVCASGLDYSQRANKFAYHVALDNSELPPAGPAWLLAMPGYMASGWDQSVRILPPRGRPPNGAVEPAICHQWQQATGDAGWGGAMIDALKKNPRAMVTLIFRPGTDPLPLVAESLALLPPNERWATTFSTYFTKLPAGVDCRWRCVVEGSPEAKIAAGMVVDLSRSMGQPPPGEFVTIARTGQVQRAEPVVHAGPAELPNDLQLARLLGEPVSRAAPAAAVAAPTQVGDWLDALQPGQPAVMPAMPPNDVGSPPRFRRREAAMWPYALGALAIALLAVVGGTSIYLALKPATGRHEPPLAGPSATQSPATPTTQPTVATTSAPSASPPVSANRAREASPASGAGTANLAPQNARPAPAANVSSVANNHPRARQANSDRINTPPVRPPKPSDRAAMDQTPQPNARPPAQDRAPRSRVAHLILPDCVDIGRPAYRPGDHPRPMTIGLIDPQITALHLEILDNDVVFPKGSGSELDPEKGPRGTGAKWTFRADGRPSENRAVGTFEFTNNKLCFSWNSTVPENGELLSNCALRVTADGESKRVRLRKPVPGLPAYTNLLAPSGKLIVKKSLQVGKAANLPPSPTPEIVLLRIESLPDRYSAVPDGHAIDVSYPESSVKVGANFDESEVHKWCRPLHIFTKLHLDKDGNCSMDIDAGVDLAKRDAALLRDAQKVNDGQKRLVQLTADMIVSKIEPQLEKMKGDLQGQLDQLKGGASNNHLKEQIHSLEVRISNFEELRKLIQEVVTDQSRDAKRHQLDYEIVLKLPEGDDASVCLIRSDGTTRASVAGSPLRN